MKRTLGQDIGQHSETNVDPARFPQELVFQVQTVGFPIGLLPRLDAKLTGQSFDAGEAFEFNYNSVSGYGIVATHQLEAEGDVFLIDHAITFTDPSELNAHFETHPGLLERLSTIMSLMPPLKIDEDSPGMEDVSPDEADMEDSTEQQDDGGALGGPDLATLLALAGDPPLSAMGSIKSLELDSQGIRDDWLERGMISKLFPKLERLSLEQNLIQSIDSVISLCRHLPELKGLWIRGNPALSTGNASDTIRALQHGLTSLEIINAEFTSAYSAWAVEFACGGKEPACLDLSDRDIPELKIDVLKEFLTQKLRTIDLRRNTQITLQGWKPLADELEAKKLSVENLYLDEDKYNVQDIAAIFTTVGAINRTPQWLAHMGGKLANPQTRELLRGKILSSLPRFTMRYQMARPDSPEDRIDIYYIMDEFGSRVGHSKNPNFRLARIFSEGQAFSILWPIRRVEVGDTVTRDFAEGVTDPQERQAILQSYGLTD
mmetsp:Transcript_10159/g.31079  ORF Transcript_10159/g.31079 Transcript_10159/m.31079 type:complete len:489 (+) Transcript_10159:60-1526(+)